MGSFEDFVGSFILMWMMESDHISWASLFSRRFGLLLEQWKNNLRALGANHT